MNKPMPAFPCSAHRDEDTGLHMTNWGMSLRDWFAGRVLPAVWHNSNKSASFSDMATAVYGMADAMLAERANEEPPDASL